MQQQWPLSRLVQHVGYPVPFVFVTTNPSVCRMEKIYSVVVAAQKAAIAALSPDKPLSAVHAAVVATLESAGLPEIVPKLQKNVGFGMGLELMERRLQLSSSNEMYPLVGMVFNVSVGIQDVQSTDASNTRDQTFSVQVCIVPSYSSEVGSQRCDRIRACTRQVDLAQNLDRAAGRETELGVFIRGSPIACGILPHPAPQLIFITRTGRHGLAVMWAL